MTNPSSLLIKPGSLRGLGSAFLTLAMTLVAPPAPAQQLTLVEYVEKLPGALEIPLAQGKESGTEYGSVSSGLDPDDWLDTCEGYARESILKADPDSEDKGAESIKKRLRGLWNEIGRAGYTHYARQREAEITLVSFLTETGNVSEKQKEWKETLAKFASAVKEFDSATKRKKRDEIKAAARKVIKAHPKARTAFEGVKEQRGYIELYANKDANRPEKMLASLNKVGQTWDSIPEELQALPGVKAFIAERKKDIKKVKDDYSDAYVKLLDESKDCLGDTPPVFVQAGLAKTSFTDVDSYLTSKLEEATKAK